MRLFNILLFSLVNILLISCGDSSNIKVKKETSEVEDFWGKPILLTPKNKKDLLNKWIIKEGQWKIVDDRLEAVKSEKGAGHLLLLKKNIIGDYAIEFKATIKSKEALESGGDLSIILSADSSLTKRYDMQIGGVANKYALIQMYDLPMAKIQYELRPNDIDIVRAEKIGDTLNLYCNDILLLSSKNKYFLTGRQNGIFTVGEGKQFWDIKLYKKPMKDYEVELVSVDRILQKVLGFPSKYRRYAEVARSMYKDILVAYHYEPNLIDIIHLRLAHLELAMGNFKSMDRHLLKISDEVNLYDKLLLKARGAYKRENFKIAQELFQNCFDDYKQLSVGTVTNMSDLLHSKYAKKMPESFQEYFWSTYINKTIRFKKNLINANLKSLAFLSKVDVDVNYFNFQDNDINSLAPLSRFKVMKFLSIIRNKKLTNVKELDNAAVRVLLIDETKIKSLEGISRKDLVKLGFSKNNQNDTSILKDCINLEYLVGNNNNINNLDELKPIKKLKRVNLSQNKIPDIMSLNVEFLRSLVIDNNLISKIENLSTAHQLRYLRINNNKITTLDSISGLSELKAVACVNNPLKSLGSYSKQPPETLFFSIDSMDETYIETLRKNWTGEEFKLHKKNLEILIELKKGNKADLKKFAVKKNEHYYLTVPIFFNLKEAHQFCKKFGGHLLSIVDIDEEDEQILERLPYNYWIGLEEVNDSFKWSTGETIDVDHTVFTEYDQSSKDRFYVIDQKNNWSARPPEHIYPFIIEWDE
ncbi:MAG: hypothetical protein COA79_26530 [Planctomycetota bacterium]|nr:MAG: hypothetical protein COA79_26530 [Planctomycetota bacterium]